MQDIYDDPGRQTGCRLERGNIWFFGAYVRDDFHAWGVEIDIDIRASWSADEWGRMWNCDISFFGQIYRALNWFDQWYSILASYNDNDSKIWSHLNGNGTTSIHWKAILRGYPKHVTNTSPTSSSMSFFTAVHGSCNCERIRTAWGDGTRDATSWRFRDTVICFVSTLYISCHYFSGTGFDLGGAGGESLILIIGGDCTVYWWLKTRGWVGVVMAQALWYSAVRI